MQHPEFMNNISPLSCAVPCLIRDRARVWKGTCSHGGHCHLLYCTEPHQDGWKALFIRLTWILFLSRSTLRTHTETEMSYSFIMLAISHHVISGSPCINIAFLWKITLLLVPIKQSSEFPVNTAPGLLAVLHKYGSLLAERMHMQEALDWISHRLAALVGSQILRNWKNNQKRDKGALVNTSAQWKRIMVQWATIRYQV